MEAMKQKIAAEGQVFPGNILNVGSFLNHQLDVDFLMDMGREIQRLYEGTRITKIVTIEASGIAIAVAAAACMHVPVVFAKKNRTSNLAPDLYMTNVHSYTHGVDYPVVINKAYLHADDSILIVDDFLACGNALRGLIDIAGQAGASVAGVATAIEKGFQHGGDSLRAEGYRVESMVIIEEMEPGKIVYRE